VSFGANKQAMSFGRQPNGEGEGPRQRNSLGDDMALTSTRKVLDLKKIRSDFPILQREVRGGHRVVYLDSAATSQKPQSVIDAMDNYYSYQNANIHRGIHTLAEEATAAYEGGRSQVAAFVNANSDREIVFTRNATESINLVAYSWGRTNLNPGDLILLTEMEHHSNLVPWQQLSAEKDIRLEFIRVTESGLLDLEVAGPKLVGFTQMSNVLGTINPVMEMTRLAHQAGALVLVDGAQSVPHFPIDVQELDIDFLAFSAHKMCGPTGIGALYGKESHLEAMPPFLGGGDMIRKVHLRSYVPNDLPHKFEAGTPAIAQAVGFGEAVRYLEEIGMDAIHHHEQALAAYALERLEEVPGVRVYGPPAAQKGGVISFSFEGVHPHDVAQILDTVGVAVRAGHHCAMPLHEKLGLPATTRASFYIYTSELEIDKLVEGLYKVKEIFV
jgi:cysteine desulfurase/selenocysteine lyase